MLVRSDSVSDFSAATAKEEENEQPGIAKKETTTVHFLKLAVGVVLVVSLIGAAMAVYRYTRGTEWSKFKETFDTDAQKIVEAIERSLERTLSSFDSLAVSFVSQAIASNSTWPFVTLPHFGGQDFTRVECTLCQFFAPRANQATLGLGRIREPE
jgi:hypothetical protein